MENFLIFLVNFANEFIGGITAGTTSIIENVFAQSNLGTNLTSVDINLVLFSDTPIYSGSMFELLYLVFSVFYTVMFVVIWYKIIKKVFVKITGWNKW